MANINEKLNYINETKSLIKNKLNDLGSEIEDETTFREYAEKIENLYDEWPKISNENTTITLNNTKKGKINLQLKGNISQFTTTGKNILPQNKYITTRTVNGIAYTNNGDGTFDLIGTATANTSIDIISNDILNEGTYYLYSSIPYNSATFNMFIFYKQDSVQKYLIANSTKTLNGTITDTKLTFYIEKGQSVNQKNIKLMLINGNIAPDQYEPYTGGIASPNPDYPQDIEVVTGENTIIISNEDNTESQTFNIDLGNLELCTIGEYQDYIYKNNSEWYLHKKIGKIILNGNESWSSIQMKNVYGYYTTFNNILAPSSSDVLGLGLCDKFIIVKPNDNWGSLPNTSNFTINNSNITSAYVRFTKGEVTNNLVSFKTWLSTHNIIVYYVLFTPMIIKITDTTLINQLNALEQAISYNNQTSISQTNNNLPFIIKASALMKNSD